MFTLDQIQDAHSKVKSGADFPSYIQDLKDLGVRSYTVFVSDGHAEYQGNDDTIISPAKYDLLDIHTTTDREGFISNLKLHQQGGSDYMTFCRDSATAGIVKRVVNTADMTCTYYDSSDESVLVEIIPTL